MLTRTFTSGNRTSGNRLCIHGAACVKYGCTYTHPSSRPVDCPEGEHCQLKACKLHHPRLKKDVACRYGSRCADPLCPFDHTGAVARFSRPCMHGSFCVKFGCSYAHPAGRKPDCEFGLMCKNSSCPKLHPRPKQPVVVPTSKFLVGQQVQAQYTPGATWRLATVCLVRFSCLSLQFQGWDDVREVPFERVRHMPTRSQRKVDIPAIFTSFCSRGAAVSSIWSSPSSPPNSDMRKYHQSKILRQLEESKQAAVACEDFLLAANLKDKMEQIVELESKKTAAVREEDFLAALGIKKQISEVIQQPLARVYTCREAVTQCQKSDDFKMFYNQFTPKF